MGETGQPTGYDIIACAQCWGETRSFLPKLPLRPTRKEREKTEGPPETRNESSVVTWGWPTARESQGHGGIIVPPLGTGRVLGNLLQPWEVDLDES